MGKHDFVRPLRSELDPTDHHHPSQVRAHATAGFDGTVTGDVILDPIAGATGREVLRRIEGALYRRTSVTG